MAVPIIAERNPSVNMNPVILPLPEDNLIREASPERVQCEPIIEEPATPEQQWTEALESDIEDFWKEDPDEIPLIKIDGGELIKSVQYYIQQYKECDSSNAIVAWNPESASIPTTRLKNVSRLRTEHQV